MRNIRVRFETKKRFYAKKRFEAKKRDLKHAITEYLVQFIGRLQLECAKVERDLKVKF